MFFAPRRRPCRFPPGKPEPLLIFSVSAEEGPVRAEDERVELRRSDGGESCVEITLGLRFCGVTEFVFCAPSVAEM